MRIIKWLILAADTRSDTASNRNAFAQLDQRCPTDGQTSPITWEFASMRKPFFWKQRKCWYVRSEDGRTNVRSDPDEQRAFDIWNELRTAAHPESPAATFAVIAENYLMHAEKSLGPKQYRAHRDYLVGACSRTASCLNSSLNRRPLFDLFAFDSLILRTSSGNHYPLPALVRKSWANARSLSHNAFGLDEESAVSKRVGFGGRSSGSSG